MIIHGQFYDGIVGKPDLDDALEHYGVLGMKWGVRKDPQKAFTKAAKKTIKLSKKIDKANKKYIKAAGKANRLLFRRQKTKKLIRQRGKVDYLINKKDKWEESIAKTFAKESEKLKKTNDSLSNIKRVNLNKSFLDNYIRADRGSNKSIMSDILEKAVTNKTTLEDVISTDFMTKKKKKK